MTAYHDRKGVVDIITKKEKIIRTVLWVATVLWMGLIFMFSAQTASESSETSRTVVDLVIAIFGIENAEKMLANEELSMAITFIVRKSAHFYIFAVLGALLTASVSRYTPPGKILCPLTSLLLGVLYAFSDELHQYFVPGRACQLRDVCIDSAGVLLGCTAVYFVMKLILGRKYRAKR